MQAVSVIIVDRARIIREALQTLLHDPPNMIVRTFPCMQEMVTASGKDDLVVIGDASSDELNALLSGEVGKQLAVSGIHVVVLCDASDDIQLSAAALSNVDAVLSRDISVDVLKRALELVMLGQKIFPRWRASQATEPRKVPYLVAPVGVSHSVRSADLIRLTRPPMAVELKDASLGVENTAGISVRERDVLVQLVAGLSNKSIGRNLNINETTVKVHVKRLLRKLKVDNRTQAAITAVQRGICPADLLPRAVLPGETASVITA